jgi:hypothetical protein
MPTTKSTDITLITLSKFIFNKEFKLNNSTPNIANGGN